MSEPNNPPRKKALSETRADIVTKVEEYFNQYIHDMVKLSKDKLEATFVDLSTKVTNNLPDLPIFKTPMKRRRQTFAVFFFMCMLPLQIICWVLSACLLFNPFTVIPMILYLIWIFFIDNAATTGSRYPFMRNLRIWVHFRDYFPINLFKTCDLDPDAGTYLFGYHPHGIISIGAFSNFGTNATGFPEKFPGINLKLATLSSNFVVPFQREITLGTGMVDASKETCANILGGPNGNALMLVVGGAAESLNARLGTYDLTLYRKGFVRQACIHGSFLVPVISFGETDVFDLFDNPPGSSLRKLQEFLKRMTGIAPAFFRGRGIFNRAGRGFLPHRSPITSVVGTPIKCPKLGVDKIHSEEFKAAVDECHAKYVNALKDLWDKYKRQFAMKRRGSIRLITENPDTNYKEVSTVNKNKTE